MRLQEGGDPILFQHLFLYDIFKWNKITLKNKYSTNIPSKVSNNKDLPYDKNEINKFNLELFNNKYQEIFNKKIDSKFLEWFIGFTEGDGNFTISKRGDYILL